MITLTYTATTNAIEAILEQARFLAIIAPYTTIKIDTVPKMLASLATNAVFAVFAVLTVKAVFTLSATSTLKHVLTFD